MLDLLLPVIVLIGLCIMGLIWTGGMFDPESDNYQNFVMAFSDASAGPGLCLGSIVALVFTFIYYWLRGLIGFTKVHGVHPQRLHPDDLPHPDPLLRLDPVRPVP